MVQYSPDDTNWFDGLLLVGADKYAAEAVNTLGVTNYTSGCWWHEFQV